MGRDPRRMLKGTLLLVLLAAGVSACSDDRTSNIGPRTGTSTPNSSHLSPTTLYCTATVRPASTVCKPLGKPGGASSVDSRMRKFIVVGKQGVYVNLAVSNFKFAADTFSFSATVQNLMVQPIGTQNGSAVAGTGVDVFFTAGPASENGSGTVTPIGTSTGTFTASGQKYYEYNQVIQPQATSSALTWKFYLTPGVTAFNFFVEVAGDMPAEGSILRWTSIHQGVTGNTLTSVWQDNASDVFAAGVGGAVLHYNGTTWSQLALNQPTYNLRGVSGSASTDVWFVGDAGILSHYNGSAFTTFTPPSATNMRGVFEISSTNVWAVGGASTVFQYTGSAWANVAVPHGTADSLFAVWASDASHVFMVGSNGRGMIWNGTAFTQITKPASLPSFRGVWGTSATNVFAVATNGTIWQFTGGTTWTQMTSPVTVELDAIGGTSATNIWAVGVDGTTINYNGTQWSVVGPAIGLNLHGVTSGTATPTWAVGDGGTLLSLSGTTETLSSQSGFPIYRIWAASDSSMWATSIGTILHYNGTSWSVVSVSPTANDTMLGLWGFNTNDVHTLTVNGNVFKWNGTTWTETYHGGVSWRAEWGDEADTNVLCAASAAGAVYCNDIGSTNVQAGNAQLFSLWGASNKILYTSNINGVIYQSTDSGTTFHTMTSPTTDTIFAIWGASTTSIFAVGQAGTALTNTGGTAWTAQSSGTTNDLRWLWADTPPSGYTADVYAVGDAGTIQHYNGTQWSAMYSGVTTPLRCVFGTSATSVFISGDNGVVLVGSQ